MRTDIRNLTMEEYLSSFGVEIRVYYKYINGKLVPFYYNA